MYVEEPAIKWSDCEYDWYWHEEAKIEISQDADEALTEATFNLHNMILDGIDTVINDDKLLSLFGINKQLWPAVKKSWESHQTDFQGRFDLIYDGVDHPKLMEFNADTPSMIIESGSMQQQWFKDIYGGGNTAAFYQSNYI